MLIPTIISLLISIIFLNFGLFFSSSLMASEGVRQARAGVVMGATEYNQANKLIVEQENNFNQAVVRVLEEAGSLPLPPQPLPWPEQLRRQLPENQENKPTVETINFDLSAESGAILDSQKDKLVFAKMADQVLPIASITKLFTAYTFLDYNPGWETSYEIKAADKREGGKIYLFTGDRVKVKDLFYFSLVGSDNTATAALIHSTGLGELEFVAKMNDKIKQLGFKNTKLSDVVGLEDSNVSTAREIARFANIAFGVDEISRAALIKKYEFTTEQGRKKTITSTNELLNIFPEQGINILGGKTGYINSSGFCFVSKFKGPDARVIVTVILGAASESSRFDLTKKLVELYYNSRP